MIQSMTESMTEVAASDGPMDTFLCRPAQEGPYPAVLLLMDVWGLREELFDVARKIAAEGYVCAVPNFWYRQGRVRFEYRNAHRQMISFDALDADVQKRLRNQMARVSDEMAMQDIEAVLSHLKSREKTALPAAAVGYCLGGRYALQAAATFPDVIRAAASMHGTRLVTDAALSPHRLAARCEGEIYCGFAEHDPHGSASIVSALHDAFAGNSKVRYHGAVHPDAQHGYALPDRDVHDKLATARDWAAILPMLKRTLLPT